MKQGKNNITLEYSSIQGQTQQIVSHVLSSCQRENDFHLRLAIDEIVQNIVSYAYSETPEGDGPLTIHIQNNEEKVQIEFVDCGKPFNPILAPLPNKHTPVDQRKQGGLGIYLVKQYATLQYNYSDNHNHLYLTYPSMGDS